MFLDLSKSTFDDSDIEIDQNNRQNDRNEIHYLNQDKFVLLQSALFDEEDNDQNDVYRIEDKLIKRIRLEDTWRLLPIETISHPIHVMMENTKQVSDENSKEYFVLKDNAKWSNMFLNID